MEFNNNLFDIAGMGVADNMAERKNEEEALDFNTEMPDEIPGFEAKEADENTSEDDYVPEATEKVEEEPSAKTSEETEQEVQQCLILGLPVDVIFKYGQVKEKITAEELEMTFDAFRKSRERDFPEFEKAENVSWSVEYLVSKEVKDPKTTTIKDMKAEIENSSEYVRLLKKNKKPLVMEIKPRVIGQKKGAK